MRKRPWLSLESDVFELEKLRVRYNRKHDIPHRDVYRWRWRMDNLYGSWLFILERLLTLSACSLLKKKNTILLVAFGMSSLREQVGTANFG